MAAIESQRSPARDLQHILGRLGDRGYEVSKVEYEIREPCDELVVVMAPPSSLAGSRERPVVGRRRREGAATVTIHLVAE